MVKQWSLLALVMSTSLSQVALADSVTDQADAKGFIDDSHVTGLLRNFYLNRNRENGKADNRDWTQGIMANYASGFTQGTLGFGVDAYAYGGLKLDAQSQYEGVLNWTIFPFTAPNYSSFGCQTQKFHGKTGCHIPCLIGWPKVPIGTVFWRQSTGCKLQPMPRPSLVYRELRERREGFTNYELQLLERLPRDERRETRITKIEILPKKLKKRHC